MLLLLILPVDVAVMVVPSLFVSFEAFIKLIVGRLAKTAGGGGKVVGNCVGWDIVTPVALFAIYIELAAYNAFGRAKSICVVVRFSQQWRKCPKLKKKRMWQKFKLKKKFHIYIYTYRRVGSVFVSQTEIKLKCFKSPTTKKKKNKSLFDKRTVFSSHPINFCTVNCEYLERVLLCGCVIW